MEIFTKIYKIGIFSVLLFATFTIEKMRELNITNIMRENCE